MKRFVVLFMSLFLGVGVCFAQDIARSDPILLFQI